jgi:hypothetical protein
MGKNLAHDVKTIRRWCYSEMPGMRKDELCRLLVFDKEKSIQVFQMFHAKLFEVTPNFVLDT